MNEWNEQTMPGIKIIFEWEESKIILLQYDWKWMLSCKFWLTLKLLISNFSLLCVLVIAMCSIVQEASAQYYGYVSSYYPSYYAGYGYGAYGTYGGYGLGSAYAGYYGKREAGFGPTQN